MKIAYLTRFDPRIFPRPLFFAKATGAEIFLLRTLISYHRDPHRNLYKQGDVKTDQSLRGKKSLFLFDISRLLNSCYRQDKTYLLSGASIELLIACFLQKIQHEIIIVKNTIGAMGAVFSNKRLIIDLMDFWHCDRNYVVFSPP